ncbi:aminoglycoside phosphotransferase/kinase family protein [Kineosporia succinea]|uniref:Uncharacterized protein (TIGR02569 family) n=1 Tax=Kineosporia succinea TaxID=84632 RepID=A0ABT9NXK5_9ACTN|nr:hypothetical protein [Kineosporia succinea]MDP9825061.1 uncharacterized protein (TIGR02569 family) [Kineosporia succinea]
MRPSPHVLDLFAVPEDTQPLPGGQGHSVRAGDLVLSPGRDPRIQDWLSPLLARFAVRLDVDPTRRRQDLRVAVPVPARDGSWVVDGWAASRYEPGTVTCQNLDLAIAAGHVLHARLASLLRERPAGLEGHTDRWSVAERVAFGEEAVPPLRPAVHELVTRALASLDASSLGPDQLVHRDLAGNVLLDADGAPVVIDVSPAWRPVLWADAVCVLDSVMWQGAAPEALDEWTSGPHRDAMLRAAVFRLVADDPEDLDAYLDVVGPIAVGV